MILRMLARALVVGALVSGVVVATGCGASDEPEAPSVQADPSVRGDLTVYTSLEPEQADSYLQLFKQAHPNINVNLVSDTPQRITERLIEEKDAPVADVVWHTPLSWLMSASLASVLATYTYPAELFEPVAADYIDPDTKWIGTNARLIAFAINKDRIKGEPPVVFEQLADSRYKGQFVLPSINTDVGYTMYSSLIVYYDEELAYEVFDAIHKNVQYYTDDPEAALEAVVNGQAGLTIGYDRRVVDLDQQGKLTAVFPGIPDVSPWELDVNAAVRKEGGPSEPAKRFLEWAISRPAMTAYHKDTPSTAVKVTERPPKGYPEEFETQLMQPVDFEFVSKNRDRIVAEWMKRYGEKIRR